MDSLSLDLINNIFSFLLIHASFIENTDSLNHFQHIQSSDYEDVCVDLSSIEFTIFNIQNETQYQQLLFGRKFNQIFPLFSNIKICNLPFFSNTLSNEKLAQCAKLRLSMDFILRYCFHVQYLDLSEIVFLQQKQVNTIKKFVKQSKRIKTILANHSFVDNDSFNVLNSIVDALFYNTSLKSIYISQGSYTGHCLEQFALEQEKSFLEAKQRGLNYIPNSINSALQQLHVVDCVLQHGASKLSNFITHQQTLESLILSNCNPMFLFKGLLSHYESIVAFGSK